MRSTTNGIITLILLPLLLLVTNSSAFLFSKKARIPHVLVKKALIPPIIVSGGAAIAAGVGVTILQKKRQEESSNDIYNIYKPMAGSLTGTTIVITGGSSGLGLESAKRLALAGATIVVTTRTDAKGEQAVEDVRSYIRENKLSGEYEDQTISYKLLNLDDLQDVKEQTSNWNDIPQIDVLLNNAGVMAPSKRELTVDGIERQMQSNHLGHFTLTALLANSSKFSTNARIINVSSSAHTITKSIKWDNLWNPPSDGYGAWTSYGQSKLANVHFTTELQRRINTAGLDWVAATLHPGVVSTDLGRNIIGEERYNRISNGQGGWLESVIGKGLGLFLKTVESGASTQIWLASGAEGRDVGGRYFDSCQAVELSASAMDEDDAARLWRESENLSGVDFKLK